MNCQSFEGIVGELARAGNLDQIEANQRERALAHLNECAECNLRLQDERALTRCLQEMAREMKSLTAPARVEEQLLKTFRQTFSGPASSPAREMNRLMDRQRSEVRDQRSEIRGRWTVAAAAVLLIVLGISGLRWYVGRQSQPGTGRSENAVAQTSPKESPFMADVGITTSSAKPDKELPGNSENPGNVARRANPHRPPRSLNRDGNTSRQVLATTTTAIANDTENEVATQFMPLGYAGPINLQDGGQLVRVELSRSAMLSMGLPVNMDRYGERVKADVLLGADGLARAIRFVQ
jgi:hypothetical protein